MSGTIAVPPPPSGQVYARGDHAKAFELLKAPARSGDVQAQALLGYMHDSGLGTDENDAEGLKWYEMAARQGDPISQLNVGIMYADGLGTATDLVRAWVWFTLAARSQPVGEVHDQATQKIDLAKSKLTAGEIAKAESIVNDMVAQ
ncbi:MAG: tetratricopeptide repeat protein [Methyloceanibacter sp.]